MHSSRAMARAGTCCAQHAFLRLRDHLALARRAGSRASSAPVIGLAVGLAVLLALPLEAAAQGRGRGIGRGRGAHPPAPAPSASSPAPTPGSPGAGSIAGDGAAAPVLPDGYGIRNFGVWLDDASVLSPGEAWTAIGMGYWRSPLGSQWDVPSVDASVGVRRGLQVGMSLPYSRATFTDGFAQRGVGDVYLSAKIPLVDPARSGFYGVAVVPLVEILSVPLPDEQGGRLHWALPVSAELRGAGYRLYGAGGYFSRGALFGAGAVELPLSDRLVATVTLSRTYSTRTDALGDALGLARSRTDLGAAAAWIASPRVVVYGGLGRTISRVDANASTLSLSAGVAFAVRRRD
ncbi:MAG TPA: hypothetical protein VNI83_05715 [Vicinamibacterales bacterium]|nr:hypothetical protein [Vicinamibacterales bacterium]